jgi:ribose 5-phosphate isomerase B
MHDVAESFAIVRAFLETPFTGAERHQRRIDQLAAYEAQRDRTP